MVALNEGRLLWTVERDQDGHRDYDISWLMRTQNVDDGPAIVLSSPNLPAIGSYWQFGNDIDINAYCWPNWKVSQIVEREKSDLWIVSQRFSTRPFRRCQDESIENPLAEPPQISGSFVTYTQEVTKDRNNKVLKNSAHEPLRGKVMEFDASKPNVSISFNLPLLPLETFASLMHHVNDSPLWGLDRRMIKLSNVTWQRQVYGRCFFYYTVHYEFEIDFKTFDRKAPDKGRKILMPGGNKDNPKHFVVYKDNNGENTDVFLDGEGNPIDNADDVVDIDIEYYQETNLLALGIPISLT